MLRLLLSVSLLFELYSLIRFLFLIKTIALLFIFFSIEIIDVLRFHSIDKTNEVKPVDLI